MKSSITKILKDFYPAVYFMGNERTEENYKDYLKRVSKAKKSIQQLIKNDYIKKS